MYQSSSLFTFLKPQNDASADLRTQNICEILQHFDIVFQFGILVEVSDVLFLYLEGKIF